MMILFEKNFYGTQNGTHNPNFGFEVIKSDFKEPGDEDVFKKIQDDFKKESISITESLKRLID